MTRSQASMMRRLSGKFMYYGQQAPQREPLKYRVKQKVKYGAGTAWELQVRTKRGWSFLREFNCHEAIRGWLTTNRIAVDDIRFGQFVPALLIMELI